MLLDLQRLCSYILLLHSPPRTAAKLKMDLYHRWFFIHPEHFFHYLDDLSKSRIRMDGIHEIRHGVLCAFHRNTEFIHRLTDSPIFSCLAELFQTLHLSSIPLWIHFKDGDGQWFLFRVRINADDPANAFIDFALIAIRRI